MKDNPKTLEAALERIELLEWQKNTFRDELNKCLADMKEQAAFNVAVADYIEFTDAWMEGLYEELDESNPTVVNRLTRRELDCSFCRPNRGENAKRKPKHPVKPRSRVRRGGKR